MQIVPSKLAQSTMPSERTLHGYLQDAIAFVLQSLKGEEPVPVHLWTLSMQYELERQTLATLNRFDQRRKRDATLRAREELALSAFGGPYGRLHPRTQGRINQIVQTVTHAYELHLQGLTEPVHDSMAKELQPEHERRKVS